MLIEFAITNFRSIKDRQVMSFRADGNVGKKDLPDNLIIPNKKSHGDKTIKAAIIYGANASGKSNFLLAFHALESIVIDSKDYKLDKPIPVYEPYKLDKTSDIEPTIFEIEFVAKDDIRYYYIIGFDKFNIVKEDLYYYSNDSKIIKQSLLFSRRTNGKIKTGENYRGKNDFEVNPNQLILSHAGIAHPSIVEAYRFLSLYLSFAPAQSNIFDEAMFDLIKGYLSTDESPSKKAIVSIVCAGDIGISNIFIQKFADEKFKFPEDMPDDEKQKIISRYRYRYGGIKTIHPVYENGTIIDERVFDLDEESTGTIRLLGLATYIVNAFKLGSCVIIDEMDKSLHPLLSRMIIEMFHNPEMNTKNAQLIFSTHDVNLMDKELFRRDQIYIIDKNTEGASKVTRLSDFTGISKVIPLQKWYLNGLFKGIPAINSYELNLNLES